MQERNKSLVYVLPKLPFHWLETLFLLIPFRYWISCSINCLLSCILYLNLYGKLHTLYITLHYSSLLFILSLLLSSYSLQGHLHNFELFRVWQHQFYCSIAFIHHSISLHIAPYNSLYIYCLIIFNDISNHSTPLNFIKYVHFFISLIKFIPFHFNSQHLIWY